MGGMDRMTYRTPTGSPEFGFGIHIDSDTICAKLCAYEDTGLTPDEIATLRAENAAFMARWTETASDNTDYTLSHLDGIYTVCDPNGCVVCEFIHDAALEKDARTDPASAYHPCQRCGSQAPCPHGCERQREYDARTEGQEGAEHD